MINISIDLCREPSKWWPAHPRQCDPDDPVAMMPKPSSLGIEPGHLCERSHRPWKSYVVQ